MIEIKNLQKTFLLNGNKIEVLKGIDLTIADGQSLAVVGGSGAGKSFATNYLLTNFLIESDNNHLITIEPGPSYRKIWLHYLS